MTNALTVNDSIILPTFPFQWDSVAVSRQRKCSQEVYIRSALTTAGHDATEYTWSIPFSSTFDENGTDVESRNVYGRCSLPRLKLHRT